MAPGMGRSSQRATAPLAVVPAGLVAARPLSHGRAHGTARGIGTRQSCRSLRAGGTLGGALESSPGAALLENKPLDTEEKAKVYAVLTASTALHVAVGAEQGRGRCVPRGPGWAQPQRWLRAPCSRRGHPKVSVEQVLLRGSAPSLPAACPARCPEAGAVVRHRLASTTLLVAVAVPCSPTAAGRCQDSNPGSRLEAGWPVQG